MIEIQILPLKHLAAILALILIAPEYVIAREFNFPTRKFVEKRQ